MATRKKYYLIHKFETKEDFEKFYKGIYNTGYSSGFKDGRINALSHFTNLIDEEFEIEEIRSANYEASQRNKAKCKRQDVLRKSHDEMIIENYLKEHGIKIEEKVPE